MVLWLHILVFKNKNWCDSPKKNKAIKRPLNGSHTLTLCSLGGRRKMWKTTTWLLETSRFCVELSCRLCAFATRKTTLNLIYPWFLANTFSISPKTNIATIQLGDKSFLPQISVYIFQSARKYKKSHTLCVLCGHSPLSYHWVIIDRSRDQCSPRTLNANKIPEVTCLAAQVFLSSANRSHDFQQRKLQTSWGQTNITFYLFAPFKSGWMEIELSVYCFSVFRILFNSSIRNNI